MSSMVLLSLVLQNIATLLLGCIRWITLFAGRLRHSGLSSGDNIAGDTSDAAMLDAAFVSFLSGWFINILAVFCSGFAMVVDKRSTGYEPHLGVVTIMLVVALVLGVWIGTKGRRWIGRFPHIPRAFLYLIPFGLAVLKIMVDAVQLGPITPG